tara:strand:- start:1417 stop:1740 length:324 start_codon:yes stop_codon:yes gene_type:complete
LEEKTGNTNLLNVVKDNLEDVKVMSCLKILAILGKDLNRSITISQQQNFGIKEVHIVEDAYHTLKTADDICKDILKPEEELQDDEEYSKLLEEIRELVCLFVHFHIL